MRYTTNVLGLNAYAQREIEYATSRPRVDLSRVQKLHDFLAACRTLEPEAPLTAIQQRVEDLLKNTLKERMKVAKQRRSELCAEVCAYRARSALRQSHGISNVPAHIPTLDSRAASSSATYASL